MNLKDVEVFCTIVAAGNLTKAARILGSTAMTVSRRLALLESELGVRLLQRTTRAVSLTSEGEEFLPYARAMAEAEQTAKNMFSADARGAFGLLRVTAPSGFGRRNILPLLPGLMAENPELKIELNLSEEAVDIVAQGYDIAIRLAPLKDSRLVAHKLADNPRVLCASPAWLRQKGTPQTLADLKNYPCLKLSALPYWSFEKDGGQIGYAPDAHFTCTSVEGVREMCVAGAGIAQLTELDIRDEVAQGELVALKLEDVTMPALAAWALLPSRHYTPRRVTAFLAALKQSLGCE
ncbi:LysR family transcriptional regulator [Kalamiella sp. sgz302252]|uniref:LysR family transcriptional regulator n=1 Tax=Pantoea sp. sgz302252 TaxID=3341827 RepID=UPI0036D3CE55